MSSKSQKKTYKSMAKAKQSSYSEDVYTDVDEYDDQGDADGVEIDVIDSILSSKKNKENDKAKKEELKKKQELLKERKLDEKIIKEQTKAAKLDDNDPKERNMLMLMIEKRKALFPEQCTHLNVTNSMTNEEIRNKIHDVDIRISNKNAMSITKHLIDNVASGVEKFGPTFGYDFRGLAAYTHQDPIMIDLVNEMSLKYDSYRQFPIELRFMLAFTNGAMALHNLNTTKRIDKLVSNISVNPQSTADL